MKLISIIFLFVSLTTTSIAQSIFWNEEKLDNYWTKNGCDELEGIYIREIKGTQRNQYQSRNFGKVSDTKYYIIKIENQYEFGEIGEKSSGKLMRLSKDEFILQTKNIAYTEPDRRYKSVNVKLLHRLNKLYVDNYLLHVGGSESVTFNDIYTKMPNTYNNSRQDEVENEISSGSGFFITKNGLIATNYHVIMDAKKITVKGKKEISIIPMRLKWLCQIKQMI